MSFKSKYNINETEKNLSPNEFIASKTQEIEEEIMSIEFELVTLQNIKKQLESADDINVFELIALLSGTKFEGIIVNILSELNSLINKREELLNDITPDNHQIKVIDKQINNQKSILIEFINSSIKR